MEELDYACTVDCPSTTDDEQMLMDHVIGGDCELCYLDTYLRETLGQRHNMK